MANLIKWIRDRKDDAEEFVSKAVAQVNPIDNNRTWKNPQGNAPQQQRRGQAAPSGWQQATHNGAMNLAGDAFFKPLGRLGIAVNQGVANVERKIAGMPTLNADDYMKKSFPSAPQINDALEYKGTKRQVAGDAVVTALNVIAPGTSKALEAGAAKLAPQLPKLATKAAGSAGAGAAIGGPQNVAATIADSDEPLTAEQIRDAAIIGAAGGAILGGAAPVAGATIAKAATQTAKAAKKVPEVVEAIDDKVFSADPAIAQGGYISNGKKALPEPETPQDGGDMVPFVPENETQAPAPAQPMRQAGFTGSVKSSREVSDPVKSQVSAAYSETTNAYLAANSKQLVEGGIDSAQNTVAQALNKAEGNISDQEVSDAIALAKQYDSLGGEANFEMAAQIYDRLANHLTAAGKTVQAASLLNVRTPEGLQYGAIKSLNRAGVEITPELQQKLLNAIEAVKSTAENTPERDIAAKNVAKVVSDAIPSSFGDKLTSFWKAGLLTGIKTQTGNALSNATFGVLHGISNPLAAAIDVAISTLTGQRTKTFTAKGIGEGIGEGFEKGQEFFKTGIDERSVVGNKFEQGAGGKETRFKNPVIDAYVTSVFRLMGAADRPGYYAQLRNSLQDLAKTAAINGNVPPKLRANFINNFVKDPPVEAFQTATNEAEKAVLGNDTLLGTMAGRIRQAGETLENPLAKNAATITTNVLMPFTKVPSAFINRVIDFTPIGAMKEAVMQIAAGKLDQRALATALSEATTGTALIYLGKQLADAGMLSGGYPDDPKEQARWKAEGIQPNSIRVDDKWLSLNYFGPLGSLFAQGKRVSEAQKEGENAAGQAVAAAGGIAQDALGQSFLQGVSGAVDAATDPKRYAANFVKNQAASVVPTLIGDVATVSDNKQREANTPAEAIKNKIPGARQTLPVAQDVYGEELGRKTDPVSSMVNPLRPSDEHLDDVTSEVRRLHDVDPENKDLQVTPTPVDKALSLDGQRVKLTAEQRREIQKTVGQKTKEAWREIISSDEYKALSDVEKAAALDGSRRDITAVALREYAAKNNMGQYSPDFKGEGKKLTKRQTAIQQRGIDPKTYAKTENEKKATKTKSDPSAAPDTEYKDALAAYQAKKDAGELSEVQDIKAKRQLEKMQVGSKYDKNIRDLYSLSKAQAFNYVSSNKDGATIAEKLMAYDKDLYEAGLTSYLKYKNGIEPAAKRASSGGRSSSGRKSTGGRKGSTGRKSVPKVSIAALAKMPKLKAPTTKRIAVPTVRKRISPPKVGKPKATRVVAKA